MNRLFTNQPRSSTPSMIDGCVSERVPVAKSRYTART